MARAIWSGAVSFGLVTVPVKLYSATSSHTVHFHQLDEKTGKRVRQKRVIEGTDDEVAYGDLVKGYEIEKGKMVVVTPDELDAVAPGKSRTIDLLDFVDIAEVDPITWDTTYYLGPQEDVGAEKPYELLRKAMQSTGKVGIGQFVMRGKQYLCTIRPLGDVLALETMYFADEVRATDEIEHKPSGVRVSERELGMAEQLIESLTVAWKPEQYRDTYHERVMELIQAKAEGQEVVYEEEQEAPQVSDLLAALKASVEATKQGRVRGAEAMRAATAGGDADEAGEDADDGQEARGAKASKRSKGPQGSAAADDLEQLSKTELAERAKDADISGRSSMTKDELVEALREAG